MVDNTLAAEPSDFFISNVRFEPEAGGYITVWFDVGGERFAEPEAMENMFVEFETFLAFLQKEQPAMSDVLADGPPGHQAWLDRLEAAGFDWNANLRVYLHRHVDLDALERERLNWLHARRLRERQAPDAAWTLLSAQAEPAPNPTWDDVMHALVDSLNATAVELYPEVLTFSPENNARLRELFETYSERLTNQLVGLTQQVRRAEELERNLPSEQGQ